MWPEASRVNSNLKTLIMIIKKIFLPQNESNTVFLIGDTSVIDNLPFSDIEKAFVKQNLDEENKPVIIFNRGGYYHYIVSAREPGGYQDIEKLRRKGDAAATFFRNEKVLQVTVHSHDADPVIAVAVAEGLALGAYQFLNYMSGKARKPGIEEIGIYSESISGNTINRLNNLVLACYATRDLINEPANVLDAKVFAGAMADKCRSAGIVAAVMDKEEIVQHEMNALLTVNSGSKSDPSFTIMEWKPENAVNNQPVVLVGKGLVFDTGGINLKPTEGLDTMKSDMAGGAAVFGTLYALALNKVPVHVVGLVPATDNRPGENAMVPGDVIRMKNGKYVEIVNTDAEGRLILADALLFAAKYNPSLVVDIATLTGSAQMAIGRFGIAGMHQDARRQMTEMVESGYRVYERIVEFPFWDEYGKEIESDIADIRNLGRGRGGGAITAGKFLAHFINYPWIHLDIAPMAWLDSKESYTGKGATGAGVRLLYDFIERLQQNQQPE
jgi:leucyl aminopeptidase